MMEVTQSMIYSFVEPLESEVNILRKNAVFAANCMVLANYDLTCNETYATDQIKVDWEKQLLVDTSTFDLTNQISKYSKGWLEPLTDLDKTVLILKIICKNVFENANFYGEHISKMVEKPTFVLEKFKKLTAAALCVFAGLIRMRNTYHHQYKHNQANVAYKELHTLSESVTEWGGILGKLFDKVMNSQCSLQYSNKAHIVQWIEDQPDKLKENYRAIFLSEMNEHWIKDEQYYESLYNLCAYDPKATCVYSDHQIKSCEKTKLLALTGFWFFNNWSGHLTSLDKTVIILKEHCDRAKIECETYYDVFLKADEESIGRMNMEDEIEHIINFALQGVRRMEKTYRINYVKQPDHPGLRELIECVNNLKWTEKYNN